MPLTRFLGGTDSGGSLQAGSQVRAITADKAKAIKDELLPDPSTARAEDLQAALEIFQGELLEDDAFRDLVLDIMDEVQLRFDRLEVGNLTRRGKTSAWPVLWTYESEDRDEFLRQVRWFSSNCAPAFGRLLTPLVDGIRVHGPLYPVFTDRRTKVAYIMGKVSGTRPTRRTLRISAIVASHFRLNIAGASA